MKEKNQVKTDKVIMRTRTKILIIIPAVAAVITAAVLMITMTMCSREVGDLELGNTNGNIINYGFAVMKDDRIYFIDQIGGIWYERADGTGKPVQIRDGLQDGGSFGLNIVGDWIYFINASDDDKIYKMRTNGKDAVKLNDDHSGYVNVVGDWIYYINSGLDGCIYKIRTDGKERTKINDEPSDYVNVDGDWIYYSSTSAEEDGSLCRIRTDGTERQVLFSLECDDINVANGWVYFVDVTATDMDLQSGDSKDGIDESVFEDKFNDYDFDPDYVLENKLYKVRTDGAVGTWTNIGICDLVYLNVADGWIYYVNLADKSTIYKMRVDGEKVEKLNDHNSSHINVVGDWIYYIQWTGEDIGIRYKMRLDGSEQTLVISGTGLEEYADS